MQTPESNPLSGITVRSNCPVDFCRLNCKILPENAEVNRVGTFVKCEICNKLYSEHKKFAYPNGGRHVYLACEGFFAHT